MIQEVKDFIEYNIDLIEERRWEDLFKNWCCYNKDYYFEDMMDILKVVEPDIWNLTHDVRSNILYKIGISLLTRLSQTSKVVTFDYVGSEICSLMGFEGDELINIINKAAKHIGLSMSTNGWYRV